MAAHKNALVAARAISTKEKLAKYYNEYSSTPQKPKPPYSKTFQPSENGQAFVCVGWPAKDSRPRLNAVVIPRDKHPRSFSWGFLTGLHLFVSPIDGLSLDPGFSFPLIEELEAIKPASLFIFDTCSGRLLEAIKPDDRT